MGFKGSPLGRYPTLGTTANILMMPGPKTLSISARSGAVHASRVPRHLRIVADAETERERGRDQARPRSHPVRLRRRHAAAVHAEQAELHASLARLRVPLPWGPLPRLAWHGAEHVDERTRGASRGLRSAGHRAARWRVAVPRLLPARVRGPREGAAARRGNRLRGVRRPRVRGRPHRAVCELRPGGKDAAGPVQRGAGGSLQDPERATVPAAPGGGAGDDRRAGGPPPKRAGGSAARWPEFVERAD